MNSPFKIYCLWIIIIPLMVMACNKNKDKMQAEDSVEGVWNIVEITSIYGEFFENGFDPSETLSETGVLGTFNFVENSVEFDFIRNDTLYAGSDAWNIVSEKVNAGFTKETIFTLTIENQFVFDVKFEDGTKNSEKNAKEITLVETPTSGFGPLIMMSLEKKE